MFLFETFIFISVNSQNLYVNEANITVSRGEIATFKWLFVKGGGYNKVREIEIYLGNRANDSALLFNVLTQQPTGTVAKLFENRLSNGRATGLDAQYNEGFYEFNITDVQYGDQGIFYLRLSFLKTISDRVYQNATITLNVTGSFLNFC